MAAAMASRCTAEGERVPPTPSAANVRPPPSVPDHEALRLIGAGSYVAESAVIAPSLLVDDLELARSEEEFPRLPVAPPPALQAAK